MENFGFRVENENDYIHTLNTNFHHLKLIILQNLKDLFPYQFPFTTTPHHFQIILPLTILH